MAKNSNHQQTYQKSPHKSWIIANQIKFNIFQHFSVFLFFFLFMISKYLFFVSQLEVNYFIYKIFQFRFQLNLPKKKTNENILLTFKILPLLIQQTVFCSFLYTSLKNKKKNFKSFSTTLSNWFMAIRVSKTCMFYTKKKKIK